jgi:hypothetical protein
LAGPSAADVHTAPTSPLPGIAPEENIASVEEALQPAGATSAVATRPKRDRRAERARAKARSASAAAAGEPETARDDLPVPAATFPSPAGAASADARIEAPEPVTTPDAAPVATPATDGEIGTDPAALALPPAAGMDESTPEMASIPAAPGPAAAPRRSRGRAAATAPAATAAADTPPTREALRETWRVGRPIPAWWPQNRPVVTQPIGKARVGRLRALALDEEISPSLLDTYSRLLFGVAVAALDQTQSLILEERLNPAYPSPLEELRVRRIIHPLAVSDAMTIPKDRPFLIHWGDVPPVEETVAEAPEPAAPTTLSWRERGKKGGGRRR